MLLPAVIDNDPEAARLKAEIDRARAAAGGNSGGSAAAAAGRGGSSGAAAAGRKGPGSAAAKRAAAAAAEAAAEAAADAGGDVEAAYMGGRPKKRGAAAPKEYMPTVGSANWAFVITLYLVRGLGGHPTKGGCFGYDCLDLVH